MQDLLENPELLLDPTAWPSEEVGWAAIVVLLLWSALRSAR